MVDLRETAGTGEDYEATEENVFFSGFCSFVFPKVQIPMRNIYQCQRIMPSEVLTLSQFH